MYTPKNKIIVFDTTLRDGEQASGCHMSPDEKMRIAKELKNVNVDVIEAGFPVSSQGDWTAVNAIAAEISGPVIAGLSMARDDNIDAAGTALAPAIRRGKGRIHTFIATSQIHLEKKLRKSREEVQELAGNAVRRARAFTPDVEFSTEDFGRSDVAYVAEVVLTAIQEGATTLNLPDTVGYLTPREMYVKTRQLIHAVGRAAEQRGIPIEHVVFSAHCHNDLGNATAHTCEAIRAGCRQVEGTFNGIGERAGNTALEEVIANIHERGKYVRNPFTGRRDPFYGLDVSHISRSAIGAASDAIYRAIEQQRPMNKAIVGRNAFAHEAGIHVHGVILDTNTYEWMSPEEYGVESRITLGPRTGIHGIMHRCRALGFAIIPAEQRVIADRFIHATEGWKLSDDAHIVQAIMGAEAIPEAYVLNDFSIVEKGTGANACLKLTVQGKMHECVADAAGGIDAFCRALQRVIPYAFDIKEYASYAVTPGAAALGKETVIIANNGFTTVGANTQSSVLRGSAYAIMQAVNRMQYVVDHAPKDLNTKSVL